MWEIFAFWGADYVRQQKDYLKRRTGIRYRIVRYVKLIMKEVEGRRTKVAQLSDSRAFAFCNQCPLFLAFHIPVHWFRLVRRKRPH